MEEGVFVRNVIKNYIILQSQGREEGLEELIGYVKGNIWVISDKANRIKNNTTLKELELLVENLKKWKLGE